MSNEKRVAELQRQLLNYFGGDKKRLVALADGCNEIGFPIRDNIESISKNPEHFAILITYSDLGILGKLTDSIKKLKGK